MYDGKSVAIDQVIEHIGKDIYFRDVNDFIDRIKDMADIKDVELVRQNLYICFRDISLTWYIIVLIENEKRLIKLGEDVEKWTRVLHKRFRESSFVVMVAFNKERYIMKNVRRRRESMKYVHVIIRAAKVINMNVFFQIYHLYNGLNSELRRDLKKSADDIIMNVFLQDLEENKEIWWNIFRNGRHGVNIGYNTNRAANNFRFSDSYNNFSSNSSSAARSDGYDFFNSQMQFRQTQFSTTYQFQNRQNQINAYQSRQQQQRFQGGYQNQNQNQKFFYSSRASSFESQQSSSSVVNAESRNTFGFQSFYRFLQSNSNSVDDYRQSYQQEFQQGYQQNNASNRNF